MAVSAVKQDGTNTLKTTDQVLKEVLADREIEFSKAFPDAINMFPFPNIYPYASTFAANENTLAIPDFLVHGSNGARKPFLWQFLFDKITWIGKGADKIGNSAISSGYKILNAKDGEPVERKSDDQPVVKRLKKLFNNPNNEQKFPELYKQWMMDLSTAGKAYVILDFLEEAPPFKNIIAIYRADYRCIRPVYFQQYLMYAQKMGFEEVKKYKNKIILWVQEVIEGLESFVEKKGRVDPNATPWLVGNGVNTRYFYPEQVIEIKLNASGTSPLESLEDDIATEIAAKKYTYAYFRNATKTGLVMSAENITQDQADQNKAYLQNEYSKPAGAWKPMFLLGGVKLVSNGANMSDVQFLEIRAFNKTACCAAIGVPENMFGQDASEEEKLNFENDEVLPKEILILSRIQKRFEELWPEEEGKFVIQPGIKNRATYHLMKIAQLGIMVGSTINESRALINLPPKDGELYDQPCTAVNVMPTSMAKQALDAKQAGPKMLTDKNPGQPGSKNIQEHAAGIFNEQKQQ